MIATRMIHQEIFWSLKSGLLSVIKMLIAINALNNKTDLFVNNPGLKAVQNLCLRSLFL
jgi:hypothetical protein